MKKRRAARALLSFAAALLIAALSIQQSKAQVVGYKGKRSTVMYSADFGAGWAFSEFEMNEGKGLYLWRHEFSVSYQTGRNFALEPIATFERHAVHTYISNFSFLVADNFRTNVEVSEYEPYSQLTLGLGTRIGFARLPVGGYIMPVAFYGRAWTSSPNNTEIIRSEAPAEHQNADLSVTNWTVGLRLDMGFQRALTDNLLLRAALRVGFGVNGEGYSYDDDNDPFDDYKRDLRYEMGWRFLLNESVGLKVGLGYMF